MEFWQQAVLAGLVPILAGVIAWFNNRTTATNSLVDQLQEEIKKLDDRIKEERVERIAGEERAKQREGALLTRIRHQDDYIAQLRRQIETGAPPPPIAWPEGLL